jgi:hypothetical protein
MSTPASYNWTGRIGNTLAFEVRPLFDCTGDVWVLRAVTNAGQQVFRKTTAVGGGMTLTDISAGQVVRWRIACTISAEETRQMASGCVYDLERRAAGGEQRTYLAGNFVMSAGANDDV